MTITEGQRTRLDFLARVIKKETDCVRATDSRLFAQPLTVTTIEAIIEDCLLTERLDAFTSRFGRLQDMLGDKFLPNLLDALAEPKASALENLDRAEKLGLIDSANQWLEIRHLRNQMIHEYIEDRTVLCDALNAGHLFVPVLVATSQRFTERWQKVASRV